MSVSYEKSMRERAIRDRRGLFTIEVINAGSKPNKLGGRICMQGPASFDECRAVSRFILRMIKLRNKTKGDAA